MLLRALALLALLQASPLQAWDNPFPAETVVSPGFKLGYTFGEGFTWGLETSVLWRTGPGLSAVLAHGPVLNLSWSPKTFQTRASWEIVSWFVGLEAGPAVILGDNGAQFGFGLTPWVGSWYVVPYYTHTFVPGSEGLDELGSYFKLPLCPACKSSGGHHDFDWDDNN